MMNHEGVFKCFPKLKRCCFCTKKLRVACVFISIWIMLAGSHGFSMCALPSCEDIFFKENYGIVNALITFNWIFFSSTLLLLISNFMYLLGILKLIGYRAVAKDVLFICGFLWTLLAVILAILELWQMSYTKCLNHNDVIACFIYSPCMIYFMLIVNSFQDLEGTNDTVLPRKPKPPNRKKPPKIPTTKLGKFIHATLKLFRKLWYKIKRKITVLKPVIKAALTPENETALSSENETTLSLENETALTPENEINLTPENHTGLTPAK